MKEAGSKKKDDWINIRCSLINHSLLLSDKHQALVVEPWNTCSEVEHSDAEMNRRRRTMMMMTMKRRMVEPR